MSAYVALERRVPSEGVEELSFLFEESSGMTVPDEVEPGPVAFANGEVDALDVGPSGHLMLHCHGVNTVEDAVRVLPGLCAGDARVEVETMLVRHSRPLPPSVSDAQAALLDCAFGSSGFGFEAPVSVPLRAGLARMGCVTVREASYVPDADLLALRGVGEAAVGRLRDHEAACGAALEASLQVADYVCTLERASMAYDTGTQTKTHERFFGNRRNFTQSFMKRLARKRFA